MRAETTRMIVGGGRLGPREIRRGLRINIVAGALGMGWVAITTGMVMTMLMERLTTSGLVIGLATTLAQVGMLVQIPAALWAERLAARKTWWATLALVHRLLWFLPAILLLAMPHRPGFLVQSVQVVVLVSAILAHAATPSWFSWMADLVPERTAGRFWGQRQSIVMSVFLLTLAGSGLVLDHYGDSLVGFALLFAAAALLGTADIIVHMWVPEPVPRPLRSEQKLHTRLLAPFRDRNFRWLTLAMGVWYFAIGLVGSFGIVYLRRRFGADYSQLAMLNITASIGPILAGFVWGYCIDRLGARAFGAIMFYVAPLMGIVWFFLTNGSVQVPFFGAVPQPVFLLTCTNLVAGALYSAVALCQMNLLNVLAPTEGRTLAMAAHWTVVGLFSALGPMVGGQLMDAFGLELANWRIFTGQSAGFIQVLVLLHMLVCWAVGAPLLLRVRRRDDEAHVTEALGLLYIPNPLRVIRTIYGIAVLAAPFSSRSRAQAARMLGETRSAIAVSDLIDQLDDAATEVREEAVDALATIASPAAVDALIAKLEDPDSDLAPRIARALRRTNDPRSVDALVHRLADEDRETRAESARTLGEIGDPRAAGSLLQLLRESEDSKVVSASSEALARLGELAAIYDILPNMKGTRNPVLKRSMACAVGDLFGQPGGFYKVLVRERDTRGMEFDRLLGDLGRHLRRRVGPDRAEEAGKLDGRIGELQRAWDTSDYQACATALFDLALGIAVLLYGATVGPDATTAVHNLVWHDEHYAVGLWYLDFLRQHWREADLGHRDDTDILLGVWFLACALHPDRDPDH